MTTTPGTSTPVYFILLPGIVLLDFAGPGEALRIANCAGGQFELHYCGPVPHPASSLGLQLGPLAPLPDSLPDNAWIVVPGLLRAAIAEARTGLADAIHWLKHSVRPSMRLITICSGALLAGRAGLLDGRHCTTHHTLCAHLRASAPAARVEDDRVFVIDGLVATSAGITTGIDLILHLIHEHCGPRIALVTAREMVVYLRRDGSESQLSPWLAHRDHLHPAVHRAQDAIAGAPCRSWTVEELADVACVSPRHLSRLFKSHAGVSITDYRQGIQIAVAAPLLDNPALSLEQIADKAGFGSARDFRRVWVKHKGMPISRSKT